jgi:hypothetical protein
MNNITLKTRPDDAQPETSHTEPVSPPVSPKIYMQRLDGRVSLGRLFERQLLGDLNKKKIWESFQKTLEYYLTEHYVSDIALIDALNSIVVRDGVGAGRKKWQSMTAFMQSFNTSVMGDNALAQIGGYLDFHELLSRVRGDKGERIPSLLDNKIEKNFSLDVAIGAQKGISETEFSRAVIQKIQEKVPGFHFSFVNAVGTPLDYLQKTDFVILVTDAQGKKVRYYAYDLKTNPAVDESDAQGVTIIKPINIEAPLQERVASCIDSVVEDVVQRESAVRS